MAHVKTCRFERMCRAATARLLLGGFVAACPAFPASAAILEPDIVHGQLSSQWPGVGALIIGDSTECTGFAITSQWIVTAAHCLVGASASGVVFIIGADTLSPSATSYASDQLLVHPSFNINDVTSGYDIGLVHIKDVDLPVLPFKVNSKAQTDAAIGRDVAIMGYGVTSSSGNDDLHKRIGIAPIAAVNSMFIEIDYSATNALSCFGDSGGPAYVDDTDGFPLALGNASFGDQNCNQYAGYQRIDAVLAFVNAAVSGVCLDGQSCVGIFRNGMEPAL
jgi:secreted trypsin-like serine protease